MDPARDSGGSALPGTLPLGRRARLAVRARVLFRTHDPTASCGHRNADLVSRLGYEWARSRAGWNAERFANTCCALHGISVVRAGRCSAATGAERVLPGLGQMGAYGRNGDLEFSVWSAGSVVVRVATAAGIARRREH